MLLDAFRCSSWHFVADALRFFHSFRSVANGCTSLTEISVTSHSRATVEPPAWVMSVPCCSADTYGTLESSTTVCESLRLDLNCKYDAIVSPDGGKINVTSLKLSGNASFESLAAIPGIVYTEESRFTRSYSPK